MPDAFIRLEDRVELYGCKAFPKPQTQNPQPQSLDPELQILNPKSKIFLHNPYNPKGFEALKL